MSEREKQTELNSAGEPPDALNLSASESDLASLTGDSEAYTDTPELVEEEPEAGIKGADDTFSHELAKDYNPKEIPEEDRIAEEDEVKAHPEVIDQEFAEPEEVLGTMSKEDFWLLVRRFNKVCVLLEYRGRNILTMRSKSTMSRGREKHHLEIWISTSPTMKSIHQKR